MDFSSHTDGSLSACPITLAIPRPESEGLERRACSVAVQYWRNLAAPHRYPTRAQVTSASAARLWDHLFIIKVARQATDNVLVACHAVLNQALGRDVTGLKVTEALPRAILGRSLYFQRATCDLMAPIDEAGKWMRPDGTTVLYRTVLMPLSEDQRTADHLLGAFSYRLAEA